MPPFDIETALKEIEKRMKAGRGQNTGAAYLAWYFANEMSSIGQANRPSGITTGREHHFATEAHYHYFSMLDLSPIVTDIREHYPHIDLDEMIDIAGNLGIKYPTKTDSNIPRVLLTDYLVTIEKGALTSFEAHLFRKVHELDSRAVLNTIEIIRQYWNRRQIPLRIGTPEQLNPDFVENLEQMRKNFYLDDQDLSAEDVQTICGILLSDIRQTQAPLRKICTKCDKRLGLEGGKCLTVALHLIARRIWKVDIFKPIETGKPLVILPDDHKE